MHIMIRSLVVMAANRLISLNWGSRQTDSYGAGIPDLSGVPFLSNSDAHSPQPEKIGREFNRIRVDGNLSARALLDCIKAGSITMNAGFSRKKENTTVPLASTVSLIILQKRRGSITGVVLLMEA